MFSNHHKPGKRISAALSLVVLASCSNNGENKEGIAPVVTAVSYVGMTVTDLNETEVFYKNATDMTVVEDKMFSADPTIDNLTKRENVEVQTRMLRGINAQIRLMQFAGSADKAASMAPVPVNGPGIAHICYQVDAATNAYERFLEAGAKPLGAREMIRLSERNPVYYAYALDPDGIMFEIEHVDVAALDIETPPEHQYRIRHVSLATPDIDRLTKFYSTFLDQPKPRRVNGLGGIGGDKIDKVSGLPGSKLKFSWFQTRNLELEIIQYASHPTTLPEEPRPLDAPGYNMIVFEVTDLQQAQQKLLDAGGTLVTDMRQMDGGEIIFGRDPDGNLIGMQVVAAEALVSAKHFPDNGT